MAVSERRKRAISEMKEGILDAASTLFINTGYEETTLRKIAKTIGYNQATIYNYYGNKEEIFFALQKRAFSKFYEEFEELRNSTLSGFEKFEQIGKTYVEFAMNNPHHYQLMFILQKPMNAAERLDPEWKIGLKNHELLTETIEQCNREGTMNIPNIAAGAFMIWSMVHGMVSLIIMDRCHTLQDHNIDDIVLQARNMFTQLLRTKTSAHV